MAKIRYSNLSEGSKRKYRSTVKRLQKYGLSSKEALALNDKELAKQLNYKGDMKNLIGLRKNIRSVSLDLDRKEGVRDDLLPKLIPSYKQKNIALSKKTVNLVKKSINKTVGLNTFFDIAETVKKVYGISEKKSYTKTRDILAQFQVDYKRLNIKDKQIISLFY